MFSLNEDNDAYATWMLLKTDWDNMPDTEYLTGAQQALCEYVCLHLKHIIFGARMRQTVGLAKKFVWGFL